MIGAMRHAAVHAQVRARHATLLEPAAWRGLLQERDLRGIAARLRDTRYGPDLPDDAAGLERELDAALAAETLTVSTFAWGETRALLDAYARRFELANLKTALRARFYALPAETRDLAMIPLPRTRLRWRALSEAPSMEAFAGQLAGTPYARPVRTVLEQKGEASPFPFEVALDLAYFQTLVRRIQRLGGRDGRRARLLLGTWIAVENLSWAFRYRRLSGLTPEETVNYTLHSAFGAGLEAVRRVVLGATVAEEASRLGFTVDPDAPEDEAVAALERAADEARAEAAVTMFFGAPFDLGAPLALLTLREVEVRDLVTLIEGRSADLDDAALHARLLGPYARGGT
ncbi:MAG TPA: V-type ATPase subunit [Trueperaceae bacterium]|nr:V-type ATPase subunit [Trueperaceae bacterium]